MQDTAPSGTPTLLYMSLLSANPADDAGTIIRRERLEVDSAQAFKAKGGLLAALHC
jgi:hypothetical protein